MNGGKTRGETEFKTGSLQMNALMQFASTYFCTRICKKISTIMMNNGHRVLTLNACSLQNKYIFCFGCSHLHKSSHYGFICFAELIPVGVAGGRDTQTIHQ